MGLDTPEARFRALGTLFFYIPISASLIHWFHHPVPFQFHPLLATLVPPTLKSHGLCCPHQVDPEAISPNPEEIPKIKNFSLWSASG